MNWGWRKEEEKTSKPYLPHALDKFFEDLEEQKKRLEAWQSQVKRNFYANTNYSGTHTSVQTQKPISCRKCGNNEGQYSTIHVQLCKGCLAEFHAMTVNAFLKEKMPRDKFHCDDCLSHIKACTCPKKKLIDNLDA